jgi:hypothetical protein
MGLAVLAMIFFGSGPLNTTACRFGLGISELATFLFGEIWSIRHQRQKYGSPSAIFISPFAGL